MPPRPSLTPPAQSFDDFDQLCEALQGWNLDVRQLDRGRFQGQTLQLAGRAAFLTYGRFERVIEQHGSPPPDAWTFAIALSGCRPFDWHGREITPGDILAMPAGWELDAVSYGGFDMATLSVSEQQLWRLAAAHELPLERILSGGSVFRRPLAQTLPLIRALEQVCATRQPVESKLLDFEIPSQILANLAPEDRNTPADPVVLRRRVLTRALDHIERHGDEALTVEELCLATDASLRTLRRAFTERFGVSPKAYLTARRLNAAHGLLHRADPVSVKISDVANRFGFWHMGKFAADYRRQFGELPSQTLAGSGGHA